MKKNLGIVCVLLAGITVFTIMQGCSFFDIPAENKSANGDQAGLSELTYYSKDATSNFMAFLQNPKPASSARSVLEPGDSVEVTDTDIFAGLWAALTEEERARVLANPEAVSVEIDESISADADSELGRAIKARNAGTISELTVRFKFFAQLKDWFQDKEVPYTYAGIESGLVETVSANLAVQRLLSENDMEGAAAILHYLDMDDRFDDLKTGWEAFTASANEDSPGQRSVARSASGASYSTALYTNLGATLQDGDVLVMSRDGKADAYAGTYDHAGIFSQEIYNKKITQGDKAQCVYTAQPSNTKDNSPNVQPDRPGYACLDTVFIYTLQKKAAVIRPKNYTAAKAEKAVKYAKDAFYDMNRWYFPPALEFLYIGDSSHTDTITAYCSKVAWHAWNKAGVDMDARNGHGNFIVPDKLYDSSINRYIYGCIKLFGKVIVEWSIPTYSATSNVVRKMSR
jgi:hypothetical protein